MLKKLKFIIVGKTDLLSQKKKKKKKKKPISSSGEPNFNIVTSTKSTKGTIKWAFPKYKRNGYAIL